MKPDNDFIQQLLTGAKKDFQESITLVKSETQVSFDEAPDCTISNINEIGVLDVVFDQEMFVPGFFRN